MGFTSAKAKLKAINNNNNNSGSGSNSSSSENWGMGLLLVFFPEDNSSTSNNNHQTSNVDKNHLFSSPNSSSPSSSSSSMKSKSLRRNGSNFILSRAQSTISICALFLFITLLLFTLSTFEPSITPHTPSSPRRFLSHKPISKTSSFAKISHPRAIKTPLLQVSPTALQGMGALYRRGTRAMNDLVVGHVLEDVTDNDLRLFLRLLHRSSLTAKADLVLIFPNSTSLSSFGPIFQEENDSFFKLVHHYSKDLNATTASQKRVLGFDVSQFMKPGKKEMGESMWGKRVQKSNSSVNSDGGGAEIETESTRLSYGSVVGFESSELDPENSLAGFLDHVPMSLRRWACYPMLLGRVRRNFKHVMLVDVKNSVLLRDPLGRVRNRSPLSVHLSTKPESSSKHGKKNSDKTQSHFLVNSAVIMGGARGVRRLSNSMLTEIVRAAMQHKKKNSVTESAILSQLIASEFLLKNINLVTNTESIPETSSLIPGLNSASATSLSNYAIIQRGNGNYDFNSLIMKLICSFEEDSSVYRDC
ncbi:uncharacterized protein LOC142609312 [Castanea sativa]|uniref:uncharacterized protein LOC142609312 n=1 Tax=Castanea sativa TaxID=21020 RepID=UPI003F64BBC5